MNTKNNVTEPSHIAGLTFLGIVLIQGFHEVEHIVQVIQRFVLHDPKGSGILGSWIDYRAGALRL